MFTETRNGRRSIGIFLVITFALSSVFYLLIIRTGKFSQLYLMGLMWCPGFAALLTCRISGRPVSTLGWRWIPRYQFISYLIPLGYSLVAYGSVWISGLGRFPDATFVHETASAFGWERLPPGIVIVLSVLMLGTLGFLRSTVSALGEEIVSAVPLPDSINGGRRRDLRTGPAAYGAGPVTIMWPRFCEYTLPSGPIDTGV
jgi:hypothetical protein